MSDRSDKALILCDGEPPSTKRLLRHLRESSLFVACDGAAVGALEQGLVPDLVVGDLDSLPRPADPRLVLLHDPDQETNDLEKALKAVVERGYRAALVLGATGRRLDHTLKNLSVMMQFSTELTLEFEDEYCRMLVIQKHLSLHGRPGQVISLYPLTGRVDGITTTGLKYPLHGESLINGVRDGSSNELVENEASIEIESGTLLVMIGHTHE